MEAKTRKDERCPDGPGLPEAQPVTPIRSTQFRHERPRQAGEQLAWEKLSSQGTESIGATQRREMVGS